MTVHGREIPHKPYPGGRRRGPIAARDVRGRVSVRPETRYPSYIAAACMEARGLTDEEDCYELRLLRLFEDEHVARLPGGAALLAGYRDKDRRVMRELERWNPDGLQEIYQNIYEETVAPVVALILSGLWDEAHKLYALAREEVEDRFLGEKRFAG